MRPRSGVVWAGRLLGAMAAVAVLAFASPPAFAQGPVTARPVATPKPGYVVPPENSAGLYPINGEPIFKARCGGCHEPAVGRAPTRGLMGARAPEDIYDAATAVPGAIFTGALDGRLRAYAAADGRLLWDYDTATPVDTANGQKAAPGGTLDMGGPSIAGGMVFIHSGYGGSAGANNLLLAFSVEGR